MTNRYARYTHHADSRYVYVCDQIRYESDTALGGRLRYRHRGAAKPLITNKRGSYPPRCSFRGTPDVLDGFLLLFRYFYCFVIVVSAYTNETVDEIYSRR